MKIILGILVLWAPFAAPGEVELRAGAAAVNITPPLGVGMAGYYHKRAAEAVHDDLFAKALVLEAGDSRAAIVTLDLISTPLWLVEDARREIERDPGIPPGAVMISATHAHTGPVLAGRGPRDEILGADSDPSRRYSAGLPSKIAEAVRKAWAARVPVTVSSASGRESSIAFNRRYHMKDGTVGWNPGKLNPNTIRPAGPIDPEIPLVLLSDAKKKPVAVCVSYAVHLDNVGGLEISADLPATVSRLLAEAMGPGLVTLYQTGCCGDVNHIDVNWGEPQKGHGNAARMGTILAAEILRTLPGLKAAEPGALRARREIVPLPLPAVTPEDVEKAKEVRDRVKAGKAPKFMEQVEAFRVLDVAAREGKPLEAEVQVISLGREIAWVALPGEIFVELGLAIKHDSPFPRTLIAELANGSVGYVPTKRAYAQGNYEVVSARCAEGSGELLAAAAARLLKANHGGK
jgi:hypothetical protein